MKLTAIAISAAALVLSACGGGSDPTAGIDSLAAQVVKGTAAIGANRFNKKKYYTSRGINVPEAVVYHIEQGQASCAEALKDVLTTLCGEFDLTDIRCYVAIDGSSYWASAAKAVPLAA